MSNSLRIVLTLCVIVPAAVWTGCSGAKQGALPTSETAWVEARAKFLDGDYLEAEHLLDIMKLQYSGSAHADSVQFLLGECNTREGKFLLAAYEYGAVRRSFPSSPLVRQAQYNVAESYYNMAPPSEVDQEYSKKAVEEFQAFLEMYGRPAGISDSLSAQATSRIHELRDRQGKKAYETAVLYYNMNQFKACGVYCDIVQEKYYDTGFAEQAGLLKIKSLIEIHRYTEARTAIESFLTTYRASALVPTVRALRETIENKGVQ